MLKFYFYQVYENFDNLYVFFCVFIGKVVYNINGFIIYVVFCILVGRGFVYKLLDM